jgi:hypothetical protein
VCQRAMLPSCWHQLAAAEARPVTGWGAGVLGCSSAAVRRQMPSRPVVRALEVPEAVHVVP